MNRFGLALVCMLFTEAVAAQPRPFESDPSFVPSLDFMQKSWTGKYDGLEPNSRMILSLSRTLVLNTDFTYTNEVKGQIKGQSEEVLLRYETGTYQYSDENHIVAYSIEMDSTLDVNILLKGEELTYAVNHYIEEGTQKTSTEEVQFTRAVPDYDRQWILLDQQLMSPIDPRQKAVYVMTGKGLETTGVIHSDADKSVGEYTYNMSGRIIRSPSNGVYIIKRKKYLIK